MVREKIGNVKHKFLCTSELRRAPQGRGFGHSAIAQSATSSERNANRTTQDEGIGALGQSIHWATGEPGFQVHRSPPDTPEQSVLLGRPCSRKQAFDLWSIHFPFSPHSPNAGCGKRGTIVSLAFPQRNRRPAIAQPPSRLCPQLQPTEIQGGNRPTFCSGDEGDTRRSCSQICS